PDMLQTASPLRRALGRYWTEQGLVEFRQAAPDRSSLSVPYFRNASSYPPRLEAAYAAWSQAVHNLPEELSAARFLLGEAAAHLQGGRPAVAEAHVAPALRLVSDRVLRADLLATIGDANFDAGRTEEAREAYCASLRAFMLPKIINYRAQKGLGGL